MNKTWENGEKPNFGLILARLAQIWFPKFFSWVLSLLDVRHYRKLSSYVIFKIMYQENGERLDFGTDFGPLGPNLGHQFFFRKSSFVRH